MLVRFVVSLNGLELIWYESPEIPLNVNSDLLSGMLEAMESLGDELKHPLQEITFSNWVIYIHSYPDFTIRLILTEAIPKEMAEEIFEELNKKVMEFLPEIKYGKTLSQEQVKSNFLQYLQPLLEIKTSELILFPTEKDDILKSSKSSRITEISKIAMAGLGEAGKTSIRMLFLDHITPEEAKKTKPTLGVYSSKRELDYLKGNMAIYEFGGQKYLRGVNLANRKLWLETSALIYVVDIQKTEKFSESRDYLREIWEVMTDTNKRLPVLSIFLNKYDPSKRKELNENLKLSLEIFNEFRNLATFHLTSIEDESSNVAIIKTIYLSLPIIILENMLNDEFIEVITQTLLPRFVSLVSDEALEKDEDLRVEILSSSVLFGRGYGNKMQMLWIKYLSEKIREREELKFAQSARLVQIIKNEKDLEVSIKKDQKIPNLSKLVLHGVMFGITKSLQFEPAKIIKEEAEMITWQVGV